jgi:hypothetical protein
MPSANALHERDSTNSFDASEVGPEATRIGA